LGQHAILSHVLCFLPLRDQQNFSFFFFYYNVKYLAPLIVICDRGEVRIIQAFGEFAHSQIIRHKYYYAVEPNPVSLSPSDPKYVAQYRLKPVMMDIDKASNSAKASSKTPA
jgi:hypothetical protein